MKELMHIRLIKVIVLCFSLASFSTGCSAIKKSADKNLNPFTDETTNVYGTRDPLSLSNGGRGGSAETARKALRALRSYQRTQAPQPAAPVINPSIVRLMWVPDHLNRAGDLVPAHYYYLKVKDDDWALQDAFDIEDQLNRGRGPRGSSATPWVFI